MQKTKLNVMPIFYLSKTKALVLKVSGHPFTTSTRRGRGVRLRWTHVDGREGVKPHVDVLTEN